MADTKTTAEAAASALGGTELVRGVQSAANVKITIEQIKTYLLSAANTWVGTQTFSTGILIGADTGASRLVMNDSAGASLFYAAYEMVNDGGGIVYRNGANKYWALLTARIGVKSGDTIGWSSSATDATVAADTLLSRAAAGHIATPGSFSIMDATAIPAGGTAAAGYKLSATANFGIFFGSGAPTLSAAKGSLYLRSDGSGIADRMFVNTNGTTTWTAVATAA